jgi:hypothetical protein
MSGMPFADLETAYELIAQALDQVGPEQERLFLAKLALALAHETGDLDRVRAAIAAARQGSA